MKIFKLLDGINPKNINKKYNLVKILINLDNFDISNLSDFKKPFI